MERPAMASDKARIVRSLAGVYNANGTLAGEIRYFLGKRFGTAHCALCDITHGLVSEKADWRACTTALTIPFQTYHLNDQPEAVSEAAEGRAPVVLAECEEGWVVLLEPEHLEACNKDVETFTQVMQTRLGLLGLTLP